MGLSFIYCPVDKTFYEDDRGGYCVIGYEKVDISCDDGGGRRNISRADGDFRDVERVDDVRCGSRYKDTSHF